MATRNYVGARYVPKFANPVEWQANTSYEAMTIVTYNNSSYTSKVPVPPTVGNPAENNQYWALTGNFNAQVEDYRQTTLQVQEHTNEIASDLAQETSNRESAITALKNETSSETSALDQKITNEVTNRENADSEIIFNRGRKYIILGDSYASEAQATSDNWANTLANNLKPNPSTIIPLPGAGFWSDTFKDAIKDQPIDTNVSDVILCGGANDIGRDQTSIKAGFNNWLNIVKEKWPNATIYLGWIGYMKPSASTSMGVEYVLARIESTKNLYISLALENHIRYLNGVEYCNISAENLTDIVHPNAIKGKEIGEAVYQALTTGCYEGTHKGGIIQLTDSASFEVIFSAHDVIIKAGTNLQITQSGTINVSYPVLNLFTLNEEKCSILPFYTESNHVVNIRFVNESTVYDSPVALNINQKTLAVTGQVLIAPQENFSYTGFVIYSGVIYCGDVFLF